jgi:hypothetical protein
MAMFSTEEKLAMTAFKPAHIAMTVCLVGGIGLSACTAQSEMRISPDFGDALRQDLAAQIADPDAHYLGTPAPGSSGARVGLAQQRYQKNNVIQPASVTASGTASIGTVDNGVSNSGGTGMSGTGAAVGTNNQ